MATTGLSLGHASWVHAITSILLLCIPAALYLGATFSSVYWKNLSYWPAFGIASVIAIIEYAVKVPVVRHAHKNGLSTFAIQLAWSIITLLGSMALDVWVIPDSESSD